VAADVRQFVRKERFELRPLKPSEPRRAQDDGTQPPITVGTSHQRRLAQADGLETRNA
jgi:hypothetical protein